MSLPLPAHRRRIITVGLVALATIAGGCGGSEASESSSESEARIAELEDRAEQLEKEAQAREDAAAEREEAAREREREARRAERAARRKKEREASAPSAPEASSSGGGGITVPNVVGLDHQAAQDALQGEGLYMLDERDCTGQGRALLFDRNWEVVSTDPPAGSQVSEDDTITICSVKQGEQ